MFDLHTEKSEFAQPPFPNCHKTQNLAISYQLTRLIYTNPIHFFIVVDISNIAQALGCF